MTFAAVLGHLLALSLIVGCALMVVFLLGLTWLAVRWRVRMLDKSFLGAFRKPVLIFSWPYEVIKSSTWRSNPEARVARVVRRSGIAAIICVLPLFIPFLFYT